MPSTLHDTQKQVEKENGGAVLFATGSGTEYIEVRDTGHSERKPRYMLYRHYRKLQSKDWEVVIEQGPTTDLVSILKRLSILVMPIN